MSELDDAKQELKNLLNAFADNVKQAIADVESRLGAKVEASAADSAKTLAGLSSRVTQLEARADDAVDAIKGAQTSVGTVSQTISNSVQAEVARAKEAVTSELWTVKSAVATDLAAFKVQVAKGLQDLAENLTNG